MEEIGCCINTDALFSDGTEGYRIPSQADTGDKVTLRFRTGRDNIDQVYCVQESRVSEGEGLTGTGETAKSRETLGEKAISTVSVAMEKVDSDALFDYYETEIVLGDEPYLYYFEIVKGDERCYYNRLGVTEAPQSGNSFLITPGFHVPEWAVGAIMYQIFVDRFHNGDPGNDVEEREYFYIDQPVHKVEDWSELLSPLDVGEFYGGDLKGVWDKLDYLESLKVQVIYLNPIFVSPSNHKYDCQDYEHVDPHYGVMEKDGGEALPEGVRSNANASKYAVRSASYENLEASDRFFARFVEEAHKRGMKVILDGVFNHCGSFNKWMDRELIYKQAGGYVPGAYESADSPYRTFFKFNDEQAWPYNTSYDGWWGHDTLPKLNYEGSPYLEDYILQIARKWVSAPFHVDGWRLDVAADLGHSGEYNHSFWKKFRKAVREANPDALILAEHYGDPNDWLQGDQWDTVMNYDAFMEPVSWFLTGMEKHSDEYNEELFGDGEAFFRSMSYHMARMQTMSLMTSMNELSNHDHSRFLTRTNHKVGRLATSGHQAASEGVSYGIYREAVVIQMTWPGAPTIYYGDETGVCGWTDPDNRRTYPWGAENQELIEFYRYMTGIHQRCPAIRRGSLKPLLAGRQLIAYGRFLGGSKCVVVVNNSEQDRTVDIPVWQIGITDECDMVRKMMTYEQGYNAGAWVYHSVNGMLSLNMQCRSAMVLVVNEEE